MQVTQTKDTLTPALVELQTRIRDKRTAMMAIGVYVVSVTKRAHTDASLRPHVWPALQSGRASTLQRTTTMRRMWFVREATNDSVTVANPMPYAVHHHYGAPKAGVPRRRVLPVQDDGRLTEHAAGGVTDIIRRRVVRGA